MEQLTEYFEIIEKLRILYQSDTVLQTEISNLQQHSEIKEMELK